MEALRNRQPVRVVDLPNLRILHSASTDHTVDSRAFPVSGPRVNEVPEDIVSAPSLAIYRRHLKDFLFGKSYPDSDIVI